MAHPGGRMTAEFPAGLGRRVEEASLNAWPALDHLLLDGWLLRFAGGFTKRANAVVPLYEAQHPAPPKIDWCERLYQRRRLHTTFRLTTLADHDVLDRELANRGYSRIEPSLVLARALSPNPEAPDTSHPIPARPSIDRPQHGAAAVASARSVPPGGVPGPDAAAALHRKTREAWLSTYATLAGMPAETRPLHDALLKSISLPAIYLSLERPSGPVGCGLGVVDRDLLGLFDLVVHPDFRRRGNGLRLIRALLERGAARDAHWAYLQVLESNATARRLYQRLGFRVLYRYWYRTTA